jgi:hypothetical protein
LLAHHGKALGKTVFLLIFSVFLYFVNKKHPHTSIPIVNFDVTLMKLLERELVNAGVVKMSYLVTFVKDYFFFAQNEGDWACTHAKFIDSGDDPN